MCARCETEYTEVRYMDERMPRRIPKHRCQDIWPVDAVVDPAGLGCTHAGSAPCHFHGRHIGDGGTSLTAGGFLVPEVQNAEATAERMLDRERRLAEQVSHRPSMERVCLDCHLIVWSVDWVAESGRCYWCHQLHQLKAPNLIEQFSDADLTCYVGGSAKARRVTIVDLQPKVLSGSAFVTLATISALVAVALVAAIAGALIFG